MHDGSLGFESVLAESFAVRVMSEGWSTYPNLRMGASRLQSHAELGGILISHETYSLVKDAVLTEERDPIQAKGFPKPVRNYKVLDHYDQLISQSQVIREEKEGLSVFLDLQKMDRASAVETLKSILSRIRS